MTAYLDFLPLIKRTINDIRDAIDEAAIAVDPTNDRVPNGPFYLYTQAVALEIERLWDFLGSEVPAASTPLYSFGDYLDDWGEVMDVPRKDASPAGGIVVFNAPNGTVLNSGQRVAAEQTDPDADPVEFVTTESVTVAALARPSGITTFPESVGGSLAAGTLYYRITAFVGTLETDAAAATSVVIPGTGSGQVYLAWAAVPGATHYRVYRGASAGTTHKLLDVTTNYITDTGGLTPDAAVSPPAFNATGGAYGIAVAADQAGIDGNQQANTITTYLSADGHVTAVSNTFATTSGADVEDDEPYQKRIIGAFAGGGGPGNVYDYVQWASAWLGVGYVTVEPLWNGPGTVRVAVTDVNNDPVPAAVVAFGQNDLAPAPIGYGYGRAPIGAVVTVATPSILLLSIVATVDLRDGYSLDGTAGTVAVRSDLEAALRAYIDQLPAGDDPVIHHVRAAFFDLAGVHDVPSLSVAGQTTGSISVAALQVPQVGTVTLTEV